MRNATRKRQFTSSEKPRVDGTVPSVFKVGSWYWDNWISQETEAYRIYKVVKRLKDLDHLNDVQYELLWVDGTAGLKVPSRVMEGDIEITVTCAVRHLVRFAAGIPFVHGDFEKA